MPGFASDDAYMLAQTNGQTWRADFSKNFNPTTAAALTEWHTLFRGSGNPGADTLFNTGTNLTFQAVKNDTTGGTSLQTGGAVQPTYYKYMNFGAVGTAAATVAPCIVEAVDVVGFYRVTSVTTATAQATTNTLGQSDTFTADAGTDICTYTSTASVPSNILTGTRVRLTTTTTLPAGLSLATDYYVIRLSDTTFSLATSYANAVAGTAIDITSTGTGTHTISWLLPRYTNGAGLQAIIFNPNSVAMGAATPNLSLGYTNSTGTGSRATPTVLPIGKTAGSNSLILYTGAAGTGKYNYAMPRQGSDSGYAQIDTIQNSVSYVSGEYCVALVKPLGRFQITTQGVMAERNFRYEMGGMPRIYDGAAIYFLVGSTVLTPANASFTGALEFVWN